MGMLQTTCLWTLDRTLGNPNATVTQNGTSGPIDVSFWDDFILMASVSGSVTGSSPTLAFHIDGFDPFGTAYPDLASPNAVLQFSGTGTEQVSMGLNAPFVSQSSPGVPGANNLLFCAPQRIAVRWVVSTGASFGQVNCSLFAR
jgi:hypothetical protein